MDLKRLRYFVTVARLRSFTRAAELLNMAQPPLSQRVQELEEELGVRLLDRDSRPLNLTPAGLVLFDQAEQVLQRTEAMVASMRRFVNVMPPPFTLGVVPANFHGNLAAIIRLCREVMPGVEIKVIELNSLEQVVALKEGRIDAGISRVAIEAEGIKRVLLRQEPMIVALPHDHPLATQDAPIRLADLQDEPFVLYLSLPRPSLVDHVLAQLKSQSIELTRPVEVDRYDTALLMIAAGSGLSIVPAAAQHVSTPGVAFRPLAEPMVSPIMLCHRANDDSTTLQTFGGVLARFLAERGHAVPAELG